MMRFPKGKRDEIDAMILLEILAGSLTIIRSLQTMKVKRGRNLFVSVFSAALVLSLAGCTAGTNQAASSPAASASASDSVYSLIDRVYSWGSDYSSVIVPVDFSDRKDHVDEDDYSVYVERYDQNGELLDEGNRVINAVYRSDGTGKNDDNGAYVTINMAVAATMSIASPYYTDPESFGKTLKSWAECNYTITDKVTGSTWTELDQVYHPDEQKFKTDTFAGDVSVPYAYYEPEGDEKHPLVVWLHGAGSGGTDIGFVTGGMLVTNFVSDEVQDIFGGAYVLLPQSETVWMDDGSGSYTSDGTSRYTESLKGLLDKFIADHPGIDTDRIYIGGCSNGGFMTLKMAMEYPEMFAACFPVCEAYQDAWISDDEINTLKEIPTWFVHCTSDPVVDISKTADATYQRLVKAGAEDLHFTKYDEIKDPDFGNSYIGHFAWVYSLKNLCKTDYDGEPVEMDGKEVTLYEWLAAHTKK